MNACRALRAFVALVLIGAGVAGAGVVARPSAEAAAMRCRDSGHTVREIIWLDTGNDPGSKYEMPYLVCD
jgi:hypothetical protein